MARLAAYYQEDFHYPPVPYGRKQRKSSYVYYEEPQHRPLNGNRHRNLGASDPALTPLGFERAYEAELYDNDSFCDAPFDDRYRPGFKPRDAKRFSYAEPVREAYMPQQRRQPRRSDGRMWDHDGMVYPDNYYVHQATGFYHPGDTRRDQWLWPPANAFASPAFLSPPSPLDSGLSSQSSPSLEVESYPLVRSQRHRACLCPRNDYIENGNRCVSRFDSGRSSPGGYSVSYPTPRPGSRADAFAVQQARPAQVRYGKLGIVGETEPPVEQRTSAPVVVVVDKGSGSERASTPDEKSPGSESPMSVASSADDSGGVPERRRATERDIRELEEMVARCGLGDRDLLDRAERRDLPTAHQRLARSSSDTLYETMRPLAAVHDPHQRAPPRRRAGLPDRVADDMALRKLRKPPRPPAPRTATTYMLCSAHFTPSVSVGRDLLLLDSPDVDFDDLSYRRHYLGRQRDEPQPPFGIPLRPPPPQRVRSDYLHAVPSRAPQPLCHPRGNPDVVRDDMAFRTLRKEEPDRIYCDIAQVYEKKKR